MSMQVLNLKTDSFKNNSAFFEQLLAPHVHGDISFILTSEKS